jgi:mRNA interferase MazF
MTLEFVKNFTDWFKIKPSLDSQKHQPPFFQEREIWWCVVGENIGGEVSGKGVRYARPVIVYVKLSSHTFLGIPTTTQFYNKNGIERIGTWYEKLKIRNVEMLAILSQIRVFDYRRLDKVMAQIDSDDFERIKIKFNNLFYKK